LRLLVAHGHEPVAAQDEGDAGEPRLLGVADLREHAPGHVAGTVLDIEQLRGLDVLHLLAGGDLDPREGLDLELFLAARSDQVEPDRVVGDRVLKVDDPALEQRGSGADGGLVDEDHERVSDAERSRSDAGSARIRHAESRRKLCGGCGGVF
jgi:hypothetical protein